MTVADHPHPNPPPSRGREQSPPPLRGRVREGGGPRTRRVFLADVARLGGSLAGLGLLAGCTPTPAAAPPPARVHRVGLLATPSAAAGGGLESFWGRMGELGYVAGQNLVKEERLGHPTDDFARELVRLPVDVLVAATVGGTRAARAATASIPIVLLGVRDPVASGFVESLARPGGNITGVAGDAPEMDQKRLQLLVEALPTVSRVAVLAGSVAVLAVSETDALLAAAAGSLGVDLVIMRPGGRDGFEPEFERAVAAGADALLVERTFAGGANADLTLSLAARHRLPAMYPARTAYVTRGGLMTYEARGSEIYRRAADYVDRILRGARPADLPVELPTRYDLVVNLRTARALGLTLPPAFLARVDEMIE